MTHIVEKFTKLYQALPPEDRETLAHIAEYLVQSLLHQDDLTDKQRAELQQSIAEDHAGQVRGYSEFDTELRERSKAARA